MRFFDKTGNAIPTHPEAPTLKMIKTLTWSSREKEVSTPIPDGESHEIIPSIPEIEEEEQTFTPPQMVDTQQLVPMDSVAQTDSEFSQLEQFVIKATAGTQPKEFPEPVYSHRHSAPTTPESYTVNFKGSIAHRDPTIEQYVRVHKVFAAARHKISDLIRAQGTDLIMKALKELVDTQKLTKIRRHGEATCGEKILCR